MKKKKFARLAALVLAMVMLFVMTVSAGVATNVYYNAGEQTVTVEVTYTDNSNKAVAGEVVTVIVEEKGADPKNEIYWNDSVTNANGKASFSFKMLDANGSGTYVTKVGVDGNVVTSDDEFIFTDSTDAAGFLESVNDATDVTMQGIIEGGADKGLDVAGTYAELGADKAKVIAVIYNAKTAAAYTSLGDVILDFDTAVAIAAINSGKADAPVEDYAYIFGFDTEGYYAGLSNNAKEDVADDLKGVTEDLTDTASIKEAFDKAVALALFNDMDNETKGNLEEYIDYANENSYTNIDLDDYNDLSASFKKDVMETMKNSKFADFDEVEEKFNNAVEKAADEQDNKEDSYTGGGGGAIGNTIVISPEILNPSAQQKDLFTDLATVEWAKEAINSLAADGVINGVSAGVFAPNDVLTREQFVKILVGALNINASGDMPFADVAAGSWYYDFVLAAYNSGIVNGVDAANFGVGGSLTREQLCTMVYRAIKALGIELKMVNAPAAFADDALISDYAKEAVSYLYQAGIVNGVGDGNFAPQNVTTRAMGAKVIYGVLEGGVK